ncbi:MAG: TolC family protein [Proteobacteria bacterium]|nr:TolC family protein [Pseudomonadota bacterium]
MRKILPTILFILSASSAYATSLDEAIETAKLNNKTIKAEDYKLEATKSLKSEAIAEFLPNVKASGQYGQRKSSAVISGGNYGYNSNKIEEISAEQPIFDGFGSIAKMNEADYKINSAASQNRSKKQEISFETAQSYCDLFRYEQLLRIQKNSEELAEEISQLATRRRDKRVIDKSDSIKFEYELSQVKTRRFEYDSKLTQAKFTYRSIVGDLHFGLQLPSIAPEKFDEKTTMEKAISNNENLKSYRFSHLASQSSYSIQKSEFAPSVSVVGSISRQNNAVYLNGRDFQNRSVYLNVSVPFFQKGVEYSNLDKTRNEMSAAREEVEATKSNLIKDVGQAIQEYELSLNMISSNREILALAEERAEILTKRFDAGTEDLIELLRAKIELNEKRISLINSQVDFTSAYYKIKFLIGEL